MNDFQRDFCRKLLKKLEDKPTGKYYREVDKTKIDHRGEKDSKRPADIRAILRKLEGKEYKRMHDFGEDVLSMLKTVRPRINSEAYKPISEDLLIWFRKKWDDYPRTPEELWFHKIGRLRKKVDVLFSAEQVPIKEDLLLEQPSKDNET